MFVLVGLSDLVNRYKLSVQYGLSLAISSIQSSASPLARRALLREVIWYHCSQDYPFTIKGAIKLKYDVGHKRKWESCDGLWSAVCAYLRVAALFVGPRHHPPERIFLPILPVYKLNGISVSVTFPQ